MTIENFIDDINNDLENRKHGLPTNPFEKQFEFASLFPGVAKREFSTAFYFSPDYYPAGSIIDVENLEMARKGVAAIATGKTKKTVDENIEVLETQTHRTRKK